MDRENLQRNLRLKAGDAAKAYICRRFVSACFFALFAFALSLIAANGFSQEIEAFDEDAFEENDQLKNVALEEAFVATMSQLEEGRYAQVARGLKELASKGHAKSQHILAVFYRNGMGVRQNLKRSNYWMKLSAEQQYPIAMLAYGEACFWGDGVAADYELARALLEPVSSRSWAFGIPVDDYAMARGARARAAYLLGVMYSEGMGVEKDDAKAIALMQQASSSDDVMATLYLAIEYARGKKVERDLDRSKQYFELVDLQTFDSVRRNFQASMMGNVDAVVQKEMEEEAESLSDNVSQMIFQSQTEFAKEALDKSSEDYDPGLAVNLLKIAAGSGYKEAQYLLGLTYATGSAGAADYSSAFEWLEKASAQGWTLADYNLGVLLIKGLGCDIDLERGRKLLDSAAQGGFYAAQLVLDKDREAGFVSDKEDLELCRKNEKTDVRASYSMAHRKARGWLVPYEENRKKLLSSYREGALAGYARSEFMYGEYYYRGISVDIDYKIAREYFMRAAKQGHAQSYFNLGFIYDKGLGVSRDYEKAAEWYSKSNEFGSAWAANNLGAFYTNGYLGEKNYEKSMELYLLSVERGNSVACFNIGNAYQYGHGVERNQLEAVDWYSKAADLGDLEAARRLVKFYREDEVMSDEGELSYWLEKAAELGETKAMKEIALRYFKGDGVPRSQLKAMSWIVSYLNATPDRINFAERFLYVEILLDKDWVGHDPEEAYKVVRVLAKQGFEGARFRYADMHRTKMMKKANPSTAFKEYRKLYREAKAGSGSASQLVQAAFMISRMYANGNSVKQSDKLRAKWMKIASDGGLRKAQYLYAGYEISGIGVKQDLGSGAARLVTLAENGYSLATVKLCELIADGTLPKEGREYLIEATKAIANDGDERAKKALRSLGIEVEGDYERLPEAEEEEQGYRGPAVIG